MRRGVAALVHRELKKEYIENLQAFFFKTALLGYYTPVNCDTFPVSSWTRATFAC